MGNAPHVEVTCEISESILVFQDEADVAHQHGIFEVGAQLGNQFCNEKRVVCREPHNIRRIQGEVTLGGVTGPAGSAVSTKGFIEEQVAASCNERVEWIRRWKRWRRR